MRGVFGVDLDALFLVTGPRQRGCSKGLGRCPNKQKQIFGGHAESLF